MSNKLTDPSYIRPLLARHGFSFQKSLGQNFLIDDAVPAAIAEAAGITEDTCVLEIGPGIGTLTIELLRRAKKVVAVELDKRLAPLLKETLGEFANFELVLGDALKTDLAALAEEKFGGAPFLICANLPYYITTPMIMKLLEEQTGAKSITVMIQREVAARFDAEPGNSDYGAVTVAADYYAKTRRHFDVPPEAFLPAPKVTSTVISFFPTLPPVCPRDPALMRRVIKAAFAQRRKTLLNALSHAFPNLGKDTLRGVLAGCELKENVRGEELSLAKFSEISDKIGEIEK